MSRDHGCVEQGTQEQDSPGTEATLKELALLFFLEETVIWEFNVSHPKRGKVELNQIRTRPTEPRSGTT